MVELKTSQALFHTSGVPRFNKHFGKRKQQYDVSVTRRGYIGIYK